MNIDPMNNESHIENPQGENLAQNVAESKSVVNRTYKIKRTPMTPTRLEYSWWSTHPTEMAVIAFVVFTITVIVLGVMIVCLTQPISTGEQCRFVLTSSARNLASNDSGPHAVVIGDFNNDGLSDIVVPNSGMNNIGIFLRHANNTFTNQITYSTGPDSTPYAVTVADFNHDQQLDIAVANFGSHTIGVFFGLGNGSFQPQITSSTGPSRPQSIATGDFNNDTRADIVVVNYGTNIIGVFLQDANGSFVNQRTLTADYDSDPYSSVVADLNNDHKLDVVVANYGTDNVAVLLGLGNGTFQSQIIFSTGIHSHPYSIAIDDLNSDTYLDIVVVCSGTNNVGVLLGYGNGTFTIPKMYSTGRNSLPLSVAIADMDNDNKLDIVVANCEYSSIMILLGDGNGHFSNQNRTFFDSLNFNPYSIAISDFNGDNRSDIAVVDYNFNYVEIILNRRNYAFQSETNYTAYCGSYPVSVVIADLNGDNQRDIIVGNAESNSIYLFLGYGNGTFSNEATYLSWGNYGTSSLAVGDFNNDNQLDIVVAYDRADNIGIFIGYRDVSFSSFPIIFSTGPNSEPNAVIVGDLNDDDRLDIIVANFGADNVGVFLGYGNGFFSSQVTYSTGSGSWPHSVTTGDFNHDRRLDIVVTNFGSSNVGVFLGHVDGTFSNQTTYSTGYDSRPSSVAVGDFNNDNRLDIVVTSFGTNTVSLFFGYGNGAFSNQMTTFSAGSNSGPWSITIGDFNKDSLIDVVVVNRESDNIGVFFGHGNGSFSNETTYSTGSNSSPWSVAVGDLNNDGYEDIAVTDSGTSYVGLFIGSENGNFTTQQVISTAQPSFPTSVAVGDFNDDGRLDITVANCDLNNVGIFLGAGDGTFLSQTTFSTGVPSQPYAIAVGDFNNDNQLDIAVVNLASTICILLGYGNGTFSSQITFSTGENSKPVAVAVGDFNNDNRLDIVVTNSETSNIGIFLGYGNGTFAKQATYSTGSDTTPCSIAVGDFNNDSNLDIVVTNYNWFGSIEIFLGYGNGTFSNQTTYLIAEGSGPIDVVIGDLNNDDRLDIVVVLTGGPGIIVFLGHGNGTFSRQLLYSIGSQSFPYACTLGDVNNDNRLDVIAIDQQNNDIVVLFGDGHGNFSDTISYSTGNNSEPVSIARGDFNNDRILDIVVVNNNISMIGVFLGFTDINGQREATYSTGSSPHPRSVVLGDFNKDTQSDIVMTNYGWDNVEILLQDMNKTFSMQILFSTGALSLPTSIAVGNFNNDNELDITVVNSGTRNIDVLYGYGTSGFTSQTTFSTEFDFIPQSVAVGDFNNDRRLDIVVAGSGTENVLVLLRCDPGAFRNKTMYSTDIDSLPIAVAVGDLNNDGWLDFVVANGDSHNIGVFLGLGNGIFSNQTTYSTGDGSYPYYIAVADLNKDSHLDIIVCNALNNTIDIFLGFGNGMFSDQTTYQTGSNSTPAAVAISDLNNDGCLDIIVANDGSSNIGIFLGNSNGTFSSIVTYSTGDYSTPCSITVGDFNNDDQLDIIVADPKNGNIGVFLGTGDGTFPLMNLYSTGGAGPSSVVHGDFNHDGRLDLAIANSATDNIGLLFGYGDGTFSNPTLYSTGTGSDPYALATGDFNNDNQLDIVVTNWGGSSFSVLLGFVNGTFFSPLNYLIGDGIQASSIAVGDFNSDDRLDIVVTCTFTDEVGVFFGYISENFVFAPANSTRSSSQPTSIAVGDFNNDTRLDVVFANNGTDNIMVLFGSGYGTFISQTTYSTSNHSYPRGVAVGDLNNDSRLDIVVANSGTDNIGIFFSNGTGTFANQITYSTGLDSQPYSVAILDFNNDTRLDIAVANYGSSSIGVFFGYGNGSFTDQWIFNTGFDSHPFALAVGDVNNDNLPDIVATNNGYGNVNILYREC